MPCFSVDSLDAVVERFVYGGAIVYRGRLEIEDGRRISQIKDPFEDVPGLIGL